MSSKYDSCIKQQIKEIRILDMAEETINKKYTLYCNRKIGNIRLSWKRKYTFFDDSNNKSIIAVRRLFLLRKIKR